MEQFITSRLLEREVEFFCLGGSRYSGRVQAVEGAVVILEWEGKETYIATDKIVAAWPKEEKEERPTPLIGFVGR